MKANRVCDALRSAYWQRKPGAGLIMHADRGSQYASDKHRKLLKHYQMTQSMCRKGNCWDNAPMESFFETLKVERVHQTQYETRAEARLDEDFIARLAALVPKPGCNLTRYHGVFAPNSAFRRAVVPGAGKHRSHKGKTASCRDDGSKLQKSGPVDASDLPIAPLTWAQRLKRVFEFDITLCPHCGGRLRVIAGGRLRT